MPNRTAAVTTGVLILGMLGSALWTLFLLPEGAKVPIHYAAGGIPNHWAPAGLALFLFPGIAVVMWLIRAALPQIDPRGRNLVRSAKAYGTIWVAATVLVTFFQAHMIAEALGVTMNTAGFVVAALGGFFIVVGNVLGKLRWNYTVGIRTPWTLADERVWDKTHRFGGWVFVFGGIVLLVSAFAQPAGASLLPILLGVIVGMTLLTLGKSYWLWRDQNRQDGDDARPPLPSDQTSV
jgi:uncharacterized membrane protein